MDDRGMDLEMEGTRADAAPAVSGGGWTPKAVEEALVQAFALEARLPDRERGWLTVGLSPVWRQMGRDRMDWPDPDAPRPRALAPGEVALLERARDWCDRWLGPHDRPLVAAALAALARGHRDRPWRAIRVRLGWAVSTRGLAQRYARALAGIAAGLNEAELVGDVDASR